MLQFPATHRSAVERIRSDDPAVRHAAFADLAEGYWRPAYSYLRVQWRLTAEDSEDMVQGFFAVAFEKGYLERYDPAKARFRTFLRTCLDRFVLNHRKAQGAWKRGGGLQIRSLDFPEAERDVERLSAAAGALDREQFFRTEMIRALFARTIAGMRNACRDEGRSIVFDVFERHDLAPSEHTTYASVAGALGIPVTQVTNHLHAARRRFRDEALASLRALTATDEEFRAEARELFGLEVGL